MNGWFHIGSVALFFLIGVIFWRSLIRIFFRQKRWVIDQINIKRSQNRFRQSLPNHLLQLASLLQTGHALPQALNILESDRSGNRRVRILHQENGAPSSPDIYLTHIRTAISLSKKRGIALSSLFRELATLIRTQNHLEQKMRSLTFPIRAQAVIALCLPWATLGLFWIIDPELIRKAFHHTWGIVGFSTALFMEGIAALWMFRKDSL